MRHGLEDWAEDRIYTSVEVRLGWLDRLRVLFGRLLYVDVQVSTEHAPGRTLGTSRAWVARWVPPWERPGGYAGTTDDRPLPKPVA